MNLTRLQDVAMDAVQPDNVLSFLDLVATNIGLGLDNLLLLWSQDTVAGAVAGPAALGSNAEATLVLERPQLYQVGTAVRAGSLPVGVVRVEDTDFEIQKHELMGIADKIVTATNVTIEAVPKKALSRPLDGAEYNLRSEVFYVANDIPEQKQTEALLLAYIRYRALLALQIHGEAAKEDGLFGLKVQAVRYVVSKYFNIKCDTLRGVLFRLLGREDAEDVYTFLNSVAQESFDIIQALSVPMLSFDETAYLNDIRNIFPDYDILTVAIHGLASTANLPEARPIMRHLGGKLRKAAEYPEVVERIMNSPCIYSYPPTPLVPDPEKKDTETHEGTVKNDIEI